MSSETFGLGQVGSSFPEARTAPASAPAAAEPKRANPAPSSESSAADVSMRELNPAQVSEALADQAMEKAQEAQQESGDLSTEDLKSMLEEVNNLLYSMNRALRFEVHDKTEDLIVRVVNTKTDEIIRQYPREEIIERRARLLQGELGAFSTEVE